MVLTNNRKLLELHRCRWAAYGGSAEYIVLTSYELIEGTKYWILSSRTRFDCSSLRQRHQLLRGAHNGTSPYHCFSDCSSDVKPQLSSKEYL